MKHSKIALGERFGRLTVIGKSYRAFAKEDSAQKTTYIKTRCDCGKDKIVCVSALRGGRTISCGCRLYETKNFKHGLVKTSMYHSWSGMRNRCYNVKNNRYERYGKRGIVVCDEWHKFIPFRDWALKNGWKEGLTIERKNNNGNYEPSNCEWIESNLQGRNTSTNKLNETKVIEMRRLYASKTIPTYAKIAETYGISKSTAAFVITKRLWANV